MAYLTTNIRQRDTGLPQQPRKPVVRVTGIFPDTFLAQLAALGVEVRHTNQALASVPKKELKDIYGLVIRGDKVDKALLDAAPALRFIARAGAGLEAIDQQQATAKHITLLHAAEGNADAVAEHAMGMLLALLSRLRSADRTVRAGQWLRETHRGLELKGKCVGLLGFGYMGQAFATRLQGFGCSICAHDTYPFKAAAGLVEAVSLATLQARSDVLSLHIPFTVANQHIVNRAFLKKFTKPIILLNTARGGVLEHEALCEGLRNGQIRAAALDVLENEYPDTYSQAEKRRFNYLKQQENVLFSPHVAGSSEESYLRIADVLIQKIHLFLQEQV